MFARATHTPVTEAPAGVVQPRKRSWSALPIGALVAILAAWAFFVPLVGPYFGFGFEGDSTWLFSQTQWTTSLAAGIAAFVGGLGLLLPGRLKWLPGSLLALAGGAWLLIAPSLYPLWSSGELEPTSGSEWFRAALWLGYFYGIGGVIVYLAGMAQVLAWRRPARTAVDESAATAPVEAVVGADETAVATRAGEERTVVRAPDDDRTLSRLP